MAPPFEYKLAIETLHELRKSGERKSELVISLGGRLIREGYIGKLGDDVWSVYEQIFVAALDHREEALAKTCLENLEKRFPNSPRVKILEGMKLEAEEKLDDALKLYDEILEEDDSNIAATKRRIAIFKAKGQDQQAMEALSHYLDAFYNDAEAWLELSSLYLNYHLYKQAGFCLEELILLQPQNHLYHLKYAEILYTCDNIDNITLALKEFCRVVELCEDHVRALYGIKLVFNLSSVSIISFSTNFCVCIYQCTSRLLSVRTSSIDVKTISELNSLASERISKVYSKGNNNNNNSDEIPNCS
ncbi:6999_t:CDS:2 [Acaulospora morrowiae]|uniref:ER membrane protein complex subunit 2 n=1 Tax=Acaulospora morrowiae TaxID=94023 RepID=A0A9N8W254_9GLOM|nr:6999_t:CDS:2 [Acaulospora morrowiae]